MRALLLRRLSVPAWLKAGWFERTLAVTLLSGWGFAVWGLGDVLAPWLSSRGIWAIGFGVLLLGCAGFELIRKLSKHGLFALSQVREK